MKKMIIPLLLLYLPLLYGQENKGVVLFLNSYSSTYSWSIDLMDGLLENLAIDSADYSLFIENMDTKNHSPQALFPHLANLYALKYGSIIPDVIICADNNALTFLREYGSALFPGIPIVFCGINDYDEGLLLGMPPHTGIAENASFYETIELGLALFPETGHIASVAGDTETTKIHIHELNDVKSRFSDRVDFIDLHGLSKDDFERELSLLPENTIILYLGLYRDRNGYIFSVPDSFQFIRKNSAFPVITMWSQNLPYCLGGVMISGREQGRLASEMALRILNGEDPSLIPVVEKSPNLPMFNYRELERFGLSLEDLPEDRLVINLPPPTLYQQYKLEFILAIIFITSLATLSLFLLFFIFMRRKAVVDLRRTKNYLSNILDSMPSVLIGLDDSERITQWNRATSQYTGISRESAMGKKLFDVSRDLIADYSFLDRAVKTKTVQRIPMKKRSLIRGDIYEDTAIYPLIANGDRGTVIRIDDVTERVEMEELRLQSESLKDQLLQAQKMDSIGRLAGGVAHDLNNLLVPIIGYTELMKQDPDLSPDLQNQAEEVLIAGLRARDLIKQLLAFSRKQSMEFRAIDLNGVISNFGNLLKRTIKESIRIDYALYPGELTINADPVQLEQVLMNMVVNASDSIEERGTIAIETDIREVGDQSWAALVISDTGAGMDEVTMAHIFEPFFSTKGDRGTGLGLSTVYGIIKQHEGDISVESRINGGTRFTITFPLRYYARKEEIIPPSRENPSGGTGTVLIVEDNEQVLKLAKLILQSGGYKVITAETGSEALQLLDDRGKGIDLLLTDVVMPEMNGKELYDRAIKRHPDLRVLFMSGYNDKIISHEEKWVRNFLKKPFTPEDLCAKVRDIITGETDSPVK